MGRYANPRGDILCRESNLTIFSKPTKLDTNLIFCQSIPREVNLKYYRLLTLESMVFVLLALSIIIQKIVRKYLSYLPMKVIKSIGGTEYGR